MTMLIAIGIKVQINFKKHPESFRDQKPETALNIEIYLNFEFFSHC